MQGPLTKTGGLEIQTSTVLFTVASYCRDVCFILLPGGERNISVYIPECLMKIVVLNFGNWIR